MGVGIGCVGSGDVLGGGEVVGEGEGASGLVGEDGEDGETLTSGVGCGAPPFVMAATSEYPWLSQKPR